MNIMHFGGQPGRYNRLTSQLSSIMGCKLSDKSQILSYLLYCSEGNEKIAIEPWTLSLIHLNYDKEIQISRDLFVGEKLVA